MRKIVSLVLALASTCTTAVAASRGANDVPLSRVATAAHLRLSWLGPERAVSLSAPGLAIVVRPGQQLVAVNDRTEVIAQAPRYANGEIYVSPAFAQHVAALARRAASVSQGAQTDTPASASAAAAIRGAITLDAKPAPGVDAVMVTGTAPAGAPIRITLVATVAPEIPSVVLSRHDLSADASGRFQAVVPLGPDYLQGSSVRVLATSLPTVTPASAQLTIGSPNPAYPSSLP